MVYFSPACSLLAFVGKRISPACVSLDLIRVVARDSNLNCASFEIRLVMVKESLFIAMGFQSQHRKHGSLPLDPSSHLGLPIQRYYCKKQVSQ